MNPSAAGIESKTKEQIRPGSPAKPNMAGKTGRLIPRLNMNVNFLLASQIK